MDPSSIEHCSVAATSPIATGRNRRLRKKPPPPLQVMEDHWQGGVRHTSDTETPNGDNRRAIG